MNRKTAIDEGLRKTKAENLIRNPLIIKHNIECHVDTNLLKPFKFINDKKR